MTSPNTCSQPAQFLARDCCVSMETLMTLVASVDKEAASVMTAQC